MVLRILALLAFVCLGACTPPPTPEARAGGAPEIARLATEIQGLAPGVDPAEAQRAAEIAVLYPRQLAEAYQITTTPLTHNSLVNLGFKPRGLCYHWADDLEARLAEEDFETLALHRAIANYRVQFRIEHSTVILSADGQEMDAGIVLDPWRYGGPLFWAPVIEDDHYVWVPQDIVFAQKIADRETAGG